MGDNRQCGEEGRGRCRGLSGLGLTLDALPGKGGVKVAKSAAGVTTEGVTQGNRCEDGKADMTKRKNNAGCVGMDIRKTLDYQKKAVIVGKVGKVWRAKEVGMAGMVANK